MEYSRDPIIVGFTTTYVSVPITTKDVSSNPAYGEAYSKVFQWLVPGRWFSPASSTNKTDRHNITEILLKVAFNTIPPLLFMVITNVTNILLPKINNIDEATRLCYSKMARTKKRVI